MTILKIPVKEFVFSQCDISHIDEILKIQDEVFEELGDESNILRKNSKEMLLNCLSKPHYTLGAFYNQQLIGFAILYVPGDSNEQQANSR